MGDEGQAQFWRTPWRRLSGSVLVLVVVVLVVVVVGLVVVVGEFLVRAVRFSTGGCCCVVCGGDGRQRARFLVLMFENRHGYTIDHNRKPFHM